MVNGYAFARKNEFLPTLEYLENEIQILVIFKINGNKFSNHILFYLEN